MECKTCLEVGTADGTCDRCIGIGRHEHVGRARPASLQARKVEDVAAYLAFARSRRQSDYRAGLIPTDMEGPCLAGLISPEIRERVFFGMMAG